jgi:NADH dehydrogenase
LSETSSSNACVITGANGFVGAGLSACLQALGWRVTPWTRRPESSGGGRTFRLGEDVDPALLRGVRALVHCAYDFKPRTWDEITSVNVIGSEKLLRAARAAGVESVVLISTLSAFEGCRSLYGRAKVQIERIAQSQGAFVIRPGLVYGGGAGGVFGRLVRQVGKSRFVPSLHGGRQVQYLVHIEDLGNLVQRCLNGQVPQGAGIVSIAHEQGWELEQILLAIAAAMGKQVSFVPVPWQLVWLGLKALEAAGFPTNFRSDSLLGMVYQNPNPSFALLRSLGYHCRPFQAGSLGLLPNADLPVERKG